MSYPQNGYHGQPQYGGYPPPPPSRNKTPLIVFSVFVVLIVLGAGIFVVSRFSGSDGSPEAQGPTQPAPSRTTSSRPTRPSPTPTEESCYQCFPGVTTIALQSALRAKGFSCWTDRGDIECAKGKGDHIVHLQPAIGDSKLIGSVTVHTFAGGPGRYPQGAGQAVARMRATLPIVLGVLFPDKTERAKLAGWFQQNIAGPDKKKAALDGYEFYCLPASPIGVTDKAGLVTSWSSYVDIDGRMVDE